jgi:hypothetical protein
MESNILEAYNIKTFACDAAIDQQSDNKPLFFGFLQKVFTQIRNSYIFYLETLDRDVKNLIYS